MENFKEEGLTVTIEDIGPCKKRLDIAVSKETIDGQYERRFQEVRATAKVPGFRKGKIPRSVIERQFGKQIEEEIKETLVRDAYQGALNLHKLEPIGSPELGKIEFDREKTLKFDVTLEVKPAIEAKDYKGLKLLRRAARVNPEEVESALKNLSLGKMQLVTEEKGDVQGGDQIICDYKVLAGGKVIHRDEEVSVWVSGEMFLDIPAPELLESLKGTKTGEKRETKVNLGAKFRLADYRDKDATLEISVREIKRPKAPEINDELAKQFGVSSLDELRKNVQKQLEIDKKRWVEEDLQTQMYQKLADMLDTELPADLVEAQTNERLYRHKTDLLQRGIPIEEIDREGEAMKTTSKGAVERDLKLSLIMENIAGKEKIYVTEQEVEKRIQQMATVYQMTPLKMRRELEKHGSLSTLRLQMKESKVLELVRKGAEIEDEKPAEERQKVEDKRPVESKQKPEKKQKAG